MTSLRSQLGTGSNHLYFLRFEHRQLNLGWSSVPHHEGGTWQKSKLILKCCVSFIWYLFCWLSRHKNQQNKCNEWVISFIFSSSRRKRKFQIMWIRCGATMYWCISQLVTWPTCFLGIRSPEIYLISKFCKHLSQKDQGKSGERSSNTFHIILTG